MISLGVTLFSSPFNFFVAFHLDTIWITSVSSRAIRDSSASGDLAFPYLLVVVVGVGVVDAAGDVVGVVVVVGIAIVWGLLGLWGVVVWIDHAASSQDSLSTKNV